MQLVDCEVVLLGVTTHLVVYHCPHCLELVFVFFYLCLLATEFLLDFDHLVGFT